MTRKGIMTEEHTVWCGICPEWKQISGNRRQVSCKAEGMGWRNDKARGWLCPECSLCLSGKRGVFTLSIWKTHRILP